MIELNLGGDIVARSLRTEHVGELHVLIEANRKHLDRWLRWSSGLKTVSDVARFIAQFESAEKLNNGFHLGIFENGKLAGGIACWYIDRQNRNTEVGYWLAKRSTGRGLATRAALAVVDLLFSSENVHRIEMQCAVGNLASRAVALRCGLTEEGIRRDSHWITNRFESHMVHSILSTDPSRTTT